MFGARGSAPKKAKVVPSVDKVTATALHDAQGTMPPKKRKAINKEYYPILLENKLQEGIKKL